MEDGLVFSYIGTAIQHAFQNIMNGIIAKNTGNFIGTFDLAF